MNEQDLRDCFAMFAMLGIITTHKGEDAESASLTAYAFADAMLEARKPQDGEGIVAIKKTRKVKE